VAGLKLAIEGYEDEKRSVSPLDRPALMMQVVDALSCFVRCSGRTKSRRYKRPTPHCRPVFKRHKKQRVHSSGEKQRIKSCSKRSSDSHTKST
jgi:hypothetical protein